MRNLKHFLVAVLVLCTMVSFAACNSSDDPTTTATDAPEATTTAPVPTTTAPVPTSDGKIDYTVTVLYPDGTPVPGVWVMVCTEEKCFTPKQADENGVAVFRLEEMDGYKAKLDEVLEGYTDLDYIYFETGATELTIQLVAAE